MVTDAVKGKPTTAPSRTAHFQSRGRAQTPGPGRHRSTSSSESDSDAPTRVEPEGPNDLDGSSFYGESDSATEMALISETFSRTTKPGPDPSEPTMDNVVASSGVDTTEISSQDNTLSQLQEDARCTKDQGPSNAKKERRARQPARRERRAHA